MTIAATTTLSSKGQDDKFLAAAIAARVSIIVSGDQDLLRYPGGRISRFSHPASSLIGIWSWAEN